MVADCVTPRSSPNKLVGRETGTGSPIQRTMQRIEMAHSTGKMSHLHCLDVDMAHIAKQHGSSGLGPSSKSPLKQPEEIVELRAAKMHATNTDERRKASKKLQRALRRKRRERYDEQLDKLIASGKAADLKSIIAKPVRKKRIAEIKDSNGVKVTDQSDITHKRKL